MGILDDLYAHLGQAHAAQEQLEHQDDQALKEIDARERALQEQRAESERAGDTRQLAAIDSELQELAEAYTTIRSRAREEEPEHPEAHGHGQPARDRDVPDTGDEQQVPADPDPR